MKIDPYEKMKKRVATRFKVADASFAAMRLLDVLSDPKRSDKEKRNAAEDIINFNKITK